jgi:hypothetical protein
VNSYHTASIQIREGGKVELWVNGDQLGAISMLNGSCHK